MKEETKIWLRYAEENLASARLLLESDIRNPALQNAQQTMEKCLKAVLIEHGILPKKTHAISDLCQAVNTLGTPVPLTEDDCDLLDSIYLPSKYPLGSALPHFDPSQEITQHCVDLAASLFTSIAGALTRL